MKLFQIISFSLLFSCLIDPANNPCQSWPIFDAHASGFRECIDEISRYLLSIEGFDLQHPLRLRLLSHLECFTERSISPSSNQSWPILHQQTPSAFATPPLSSYSSSTIGYHHQTNPNFNMHHYQRPPVDSSCQLSSSSSSCI
jgi:YRPW motif-containing protein